MKFKDYLNESKGRYYTEIRLYDGDNDYLSDDYYDNSRNPEAQLSKAIKFAKKKFKGEGKIKLNVIDTQHKNGTWNIISKEIKA